MSTRQKKWISPLVVPLMMVLFINPTEAEETANVTVRVSIQKLSVSITSNNTWNIGMVTAGSVRTMTDSEKIILLNDGTGRQTYTLQVTNTGGAWEASSTESPAANRFVLSGIFSAVTDTGIVGANFNTGKNDDVIRDTSPKTATDVIFAADTNATANGVSVPPGESRALWLQFKAPTSSTVYTEQSIIVTIGVIGG